MTMYGLRGLEDDPAAALSDAVSQAKSKLGDAGLWAVAIMVLVAAVAFKPSRR